MKIYKYPYNKEHTRNETEKFIADSVVKYMKEEGTEICGKIFVKRTPLGKPFVEGCGELYVSVTHAGEIVLVAVSRNEIGIDCEPVARRTRDVNAMAGRFFTPSERELIKSVDDTEKERVFLEVWTKKEALVKLSGEGLVALSSTDSEKLPHNVELTMLNDFQGYITAVAQRKQ